MLAQMGQQAPAKRSEGKPEWGSAPRTSIVLPAALTWGSNRPAARRGQWWTGDNAACRVRGPIQEGSHSVTGTLVIHSYMVGEGVAHGVVGLPIVATDLLRFPADLLRTEHSRVSACG